MAPVIQDRPRRTPMSKSKSNAVPNIPELADRLATPQYLVPPGSEPKLPGAAGGHQFGFSRPVQVNQRMLSSNIDPALKGIGDVVDDDDDMEADIGNGGGEEEMDNGSEVDEVSHVNDSFTLADSKKDPSDGDGAEGEAAEFDDDGISELDGTSAPIEIPS